MKESDLKKIENLLKRSWNLSTPLKSIKKYKDKKGNEEYYADYESDFPKEERKLNKEYLKFKLKVAKASGY